MTRINGGNSIIRITQLAPEFVYLLSGVHVEYAPIGLPSDVGSIVTIVKHGGSGLETVGAAVLEQRTYRGVGVFFLHSMGTPVVPGDSGGGVWFNGSLVGNTWWTDAAYDEDGYFLGYMDTFVAAQIPFQ